MGRPARRALLLVALGLLSNSISSAKPKGVQVPTPGERHLQELELQGGVPPAPLPGVAPRNRTGVAPRNRTVGVPPYPHDQGMGPNGTCSTPLQPDHRADQLAERAWCRSLLGLGLHDDDGAADAPPPPPPAWALEHTGAAGNLTIDAVIVSG